MGYSSPQMCVADGALDHRTAAMTHRSARTMSSGARPKGRPRGWSTLAIHNESELATIAVAMADPNPHVGVEMHNHEYRGEVVLSSFLCAHAVLGRGRARRPREQPNQKITRE